MSETRRVLAIVAATENTNRINRTNWTLVESSRGSAPRWSIEEVVLEDFGTIMKARGFQVALDEFDETLRGALESVRPDALIVSSKGVGILTHLAQGGRWNGPAVLLSPIPNESDHVEGGSWESEWKSTTNTLVSRGVGPIAIGIGTSVDEQTLILESIEETGMCGNYLRGRQMFQKCSWHLRSFPGNHYWKNDPANAQGIATLIDAVFFLQRHQNERMKKEESDSRDGDEDSVVGPQKCPGHL